MFIQYSYLFVACFNLQVDVRPTLEMLRNAGIKVTQLLKEARCKLMAPSFVLFLSLFSHLFIQSVYFFFIFS